MFDMFIAGRETTSDTLTWACAYLTACPKVQERLHQELSEVIDSDRIVTIEDKNNLPYTNAVIQETTRIANLLPQNILHETTREVSINGFKIPERTGIVNQISCVLYDENIFPEPKKFKPERFIDSQGKFIQHSAVIPFSVGKRSCMGEGLARMELFLVIANLFNRFKVRFNLIYPLYLFFS